MKAPVRRDSLCFCGLLSQSVASFPSSSVDPGNQLGCKPNLRHVVMYHCWLLLFYEQKLQAVYKVRKLHRRQNWRGNAPPTTFQLILFPTSMASGNKVLDTFSVTQCKTFSCLHHANIIMPSELHGPVPSYRNGQTLCIHMYVKVWAWDYFQMCYAIPAWSLHPKCVFNLHLRHSCTFAYTQTGSMFTLLLSITKASLPPVSRLCSFLGYNVYRIASQTNYLC